jgi:hypothetical protein
VIEKEELVRIPVRIFGDHLEYYYEGALPRITEGTIGDLVLAKEALENPADLKRLNEKRAVPFLRKGTVLLAQLKPKHASHEQMQNLVSVPNGMTLYDDGLYFSEIVLDGTLHLEFRGSKHARLKPVECSLPALQSKAQSLNHAYSLLSVFFESWRHSHTGNVFQKVFYYEQNNKRWLPLSDLRDQLMPLYERRLDRGGGGSAPGND